MPWDIRFQWNTVWKGQMEETGSGVCPFAGFVISGDEISLFATGYLHSYVTMCFIYLFVQFLIS
jgi:hypothetical protein